LWHQRTLIGSTGKYEQQKDIAHLSPPAFDRRMAEQDNSIFVITSVVEIIFTETECQVKEMSRKAIKATLEGASHNVLRGGSILD
jgi:hypothetical protein